MHLIAGSWAADHLREKFGPDAVCAFPDPLSVGPVAGALGDLATWLDDRAEFWRAVTGEAASLDDSELTRLIHAPEITMWCGLGVVDQLLAGWVCARAATERVAPRLRMVRFSSTPSRSGELRVVASTGHLGKEALLDAQEPMPLSSDDARCLHALWSAWTAPTPASLVGLSASSDAVTRAVAGALLDRYPDLAHGLGGWDLAVLRQIGAHGPKVTRAIGHTLGEKLDGLDDVGDYWILDRVRRLGGGPEPLLQVEATSQEMRDTTATLTDAGRAVLSGLRPAYEFRDVDDFVGGVHLSTSQDRVWLRTSDGLARWHRTA